MDNFTTVQDTAIVREFLQNISGDELEIRRARSKLYAIVSHYSHLLEGENYDVNLKDAQFRGLMNGAVASYGPLQVVGTHHNDEFLWSWHNKSIPDEAHCLVRSFCESEPLLSELVTQTKFECSLASAERMSQWIAVKIGWLGAFEAPNAQAVAMLVVKLNPGSNPNEFQDNIVWCSFCGRAQMQVAQLFKAAETCSICNLCVEQFKQIAAESPATAADDKFEDPMDGMSPCLLCGGKSRRIFSEYGSVCHECLRLSVFDALA